MLTFRNAIAAITMTVAALCGGGKAAVAEQKGTLSVSEVRTAPALRSKTHKRADDIVTIVSTAAVGVTTEQNDETRATDDDRAASMRPRAIAPVFGPIHAQILQVHQIVSETVRLRPPTRAPPHGIANRLADALGRA